MERLEEEMKQHSDEAMAYLDEFNFDMCHHHEDKAKGIKQAIEIVKEEMK